LFATLLVVLLTATALTEFFAAGLAAVLLAGLATGFAAAFTGVLAAGFAAVFFAATGAALAGDFFTAAAEVLLGAFPAVFPELFAGAFADALTALPALAACTLAGIDFTVFFAATALVAADLEVAVLAVGFADFVIALAMKSKLKGRRADGAEAAPCSTCCF
jgi:hypothetical protein